MASYCTQKERENILIRQRQGIAAMKIVDGRKISLKTGRPTGRPETDYPENWDDVYHKWKNGGNNCCGFAPRQFLGLKTYTFYSSFISMRRSIQQILLIRSNNLPFPVSLF